MDVRRTSTLTFKIHIFNSLKKILDVNLSKLKNEFLIWFISISVIRRISKEKWIHLEHEKILNFKNFYSIHWRSYMGAKGAFVLEFVFCLLFDDFSLSVFDLLPLIFKLSPLLTQYQNN